MNSKVAGPEGSSIGIHGMVDFLICFIKVFHFFVGFFLVKIWFIYHLAYYNCIGVSYL